MNDNVNDTDVLERLHSSLGGVRMRRPIDEITARGRGLRTRRRSIAGATAVGVLGASLAFALPLSGSSAQPVAARSQAQSQAVNVDLAAWSVHTNADSTVTITIRELRDPDMLRQVLAKAGVPAIVTVGTCVRNGDGMPQIGIVLSHMRKPDGTIFTIKPSAMPPGAVLSIDYVTLGEGHASAIVIALLAHAQTCTGK
jgi:hypothetical protein